MDAIHTMLLDAKSGRLVAARDHRVVKLILIMPLVDREVQRYLRRRRQLLEQGQAGGTGSPLLRPRAGDDRGPDRLDRKRVGIQWATFPHLFADYYVFQYATGISGANALARRVLSGGPSAAQDYLGFLKAGGSKYPLDALKSAGVDLATSQPVETAFGVLADLIERLDELVN